MSRGWNPTCAVSNRPEANVNAAPLPTIAAAEPQQPADTPIPTQIPTLVLRTETVSTMAPTEDPNLSPADRHLNSLMNASVVFNLDGNVICLAIQNNGR